METRMQPTTETSEQELVIERTFDAPRKLVWEAWTQPERVRVWWGPKHFITPVYEIDLRVGGKFLLCMRSPEGQEIWGTGVYREIVPQERIVATDNFADAEGRVVPASYYGMKADYSQEMVYTVMFKEQGGKTRLTLKYVGIPPGEDLEMAQDGWIQSLDKLAEYLK